MKACDDRERSWFSSCVTTIASAGAELRGGRSARSEEDDRAGGGGDGREVVDDGDDVQRRRHRRHGDGAIHAGGTYRAKIRCAAAPQGMRMHERLGGEPERKYEREERDAAKHAWHQHTA